MGSLGKTSYHTSPWGFYPFLSSFLEPLWPISFHFTFLLPLIVPVALLTHWTLPLSLGSHGPFTLLLPFIAFVGLRAHWTLFSTFFFLWAFMTLLLCFYLLLCLWACLLSFPAILAYWALFFSFFLSSLGFYDPFASILLFYSFLLYFCLLLGLYAIESPLSFFFFLNKKWGINRK